jgi:hypothetical protein
VGTPVIGSTGDKAGDQRGQRTLYGGIAAQYWDRTDTGTSILVVVARIKEIINKLKIIKNFFSLYIIHLIVYNYFFISIKSLKE